MDRTRWEQANGTTPTSAGIRIGIGIESGRKVGRRGQLRRAQLRGRVRSAIGSAGKQQSLAREAKERAAARVNAGADAGADASAGAGGGGGADAGADVDVMAAWRAREAAKRRAVAEALATKQHVTLYSTSDRVDPPDAIGRRAVRRVARGNSRHDGVKREDEDEDKDDADAEDGDEDEVERVTGVGGTEELGVAAAYSWGRSKRTQHLERVAMEQRTALVLAEATRTRAPRPGTAPAPGPVRHQRKGGSGANTASPRSLLDGAADHAVVWGFGSGLGGRLDAVADSQTRERSRNLAAAFGEQRRLEMKKSREQAQAAALALTRR